MNTTEQRGVVTIRWKGDDPDDVVAPWPIDHVVPLQIHIERMSDGDIWLEIHNPEQGDDVAMWFRATHKNRLEWTVRKP